ncbi:MAG: Thiazole synthase [Alphaproteobacteria bacterium MarineAlpha2_Bin1]|nr:MAG: Thiazole synthase [Alphaproteobacteria bacterium MarineAlpha2_Bin1]
MIIQVNGEKISFKDSISISELILNLKFDHRKIALEYNLEILPRSLYESTFIKNNDKIEIVHFIGGGMENNDDLWEVGGYKFKSRLIIGTGKYKDYLQNKEAAEAAEVELITVAIRRVNLSDPKKPMLVDYLDPKKFVFLPNTAGCYTGEEAVRTLRLAREAGGWDLVKLEVLGDEKTLYPNMPETLKSAELLIKDGFKVMVYCSDDPIQAKILEEIGCSAIMPLGAPIGSGLGIQNPLNIKMIIENSSVPVIVDAGVGTASDAAIAMELGCTAVLINSAIASSRNPVLMAKSMRYAVLAGRASYVAGRMEKKFYATASTPHEGKI